MTGRHPFDAEPLAPRTPHIARGEALEQAIATTAMCALTVARGSG
ncbi:hypothetical protein [Streptomyces sp. HUAS ZL42]